jgi:hypothetical protein
VGATAANSFGPLLRFIFGTEFAARRLTGFLARNAVHEPAVAERELVAA